MVPKQPAQFTIRCQWSILEQCHFGLTLLLDAALYTLIFPLHKLPTCYRLMGTHAAENTVKKGRFLPRSTEFLPPRAILPFPPFLNRCILLPVHPCKCLDINLSLSTGRTICNQELELYKNMKITVRAAEEASYTSDQ